MSDAHLAARLGVIDPPSPYSSAVVLTEEEAMAGKPNGLKKCFRPKELRCVERPCLNFIWKRCNIFCKKKEAALL
jgi:hypothetical protein